MAGASGVRAGKAFIEVFADGSALNRGLRGIEKRLSTFARSLKAVGATTMGIGAAAVAPLAAATTLFGGYEDALASLRSAANPTAEELDRIRVAIADLSKQTGVGPASVARAMTELLKAGMDLDVVLGGATKAAVEFARVAEIDVAKAATILTDAMNVFGGTAADAVDTLSRAADASSISVDDVTMAFSQASAVAKMAGLSMAETANAIAIMGQAGVKGSDAGTSLKTMLLRLVAPADDGAKAIEELGINVREADGRMKDMRSILAELQGRLGGMNQEARDTALRRVFGTDAIRAGTILLDRGVAGWDEFNAKMAEGLPVSAKYAMLMDTLSGFLSRLLAGVERLAVEIGTALAPVLRDWGASLQGVLEIAGRLAHENQGLIVGVAKVAAGLIAGGAAMVGFGIAATVASKAFAVLRTTLVLMSNPFGLIVVGAAAAGAAFAALTDTGRSALSSLAGTATAAFQGIGNALRKGDLAAAGEIFWGSLMVVFQKGVNWLNELWQGLRLTLGKVFSDVSFGMAESFIGAIASIRMAWTTGINALADVVDVVFAGIAKAIVKFVGFVSSEWAKIKALFSGRFVDDRLVKELNDISAKTTRSLAEIDKQRDTRSAGRRDAVAAIGSDRDAMLAMLDDQRAAADADRERTAGESLAEGAAKLAGLEAELADALTRAATSPIEAATTPGDVAGTPTATAPEPPMESTRRMAKGVEAAGSFSAAAIRGMGIGGTLADRATTAAERTADGIDKLNDKARNDRLVFTS